MNPLINSSHFTCVGCGRASIFRKVIICSWKSTISYLEMTKNKSRKSKKITIFALFSLITFNRKDQEIYLLKITNLSCFFLILLLCNTLEPVVTYIIHMSGLSHHPVCLPVSTSMSQYYQFCNKVELLKT